MSDAENISSSDSDPGTVIVQNRCDIATGSSSAVGAPVVARRKWTDDADILLLKEVEARKEHIPVFGKATETYSATALTGKYLGDRREELQGQLHAAYEDFQKKRPNWAFFDRDRGRFRRKRGTPDRSHRGGGLMERQAGTGQKATNTNEIKD
jgi:hypothetical protein